MRVFRGFLKSFRGFGGVNSRVNRGRIEGECDRVIRSVVGAHNGSSLLLVAVRIWDHVCASRGGNVGFSREIEGEFFIFWIWGGARGEVMCE